MIPSSLWGGKLPQIHSDEEYVQKVCSQCYTTSCSYVYVYFILIFQQHFLSSSIAMSNLVCLPFHNKYFNVHIIIQFTLALDWTNNKKNKSIFLYLIYDNYLLLMHNVKYDLIWQKYGPWWLYKAIAIKWGDLGRAGNLGRCLIGTYWGSPDRWHTLTQTN